MDEAALIWESLMVKLLSKKGPNYEVICTQLLNQWLELSAST